MGSLIFCEGDAIDKVTTTRYSKKYELIRVNPPGVAVILRLYRVY